MTSKKTYDGAPVVLGAVMLRRRAQIGVVIIAHHSVAAVARAREWQQLFERKDQRQKLRQHVGVVYGEVRLDGGKRWHIL